MVRHDLCECQTHINSYFDIRFINIETYVPLTSLAFISLAITSLVITSLAIIISYQPFFKSQREFAQKPCLQQMQ